MSGRTRFKRQSTMASRRASKPAVPDPQDLTRVIDDAHLARMLEDARCWPSHYKLLFKAGDLVALISELQRHRQLEHNHYWGEDDE